MAIVKNDLKKCPYCMFVKNNGSHKKWIKQKRWQFPKEKLNSTKILWNARDLLPNFLMHARTNDPFFVKWPSIVALGFETKSCRTDSFTDLNIKKNGKMFNLVESAVCHWIHSRSTVGYMPWNLCKVVIKKLWLI